MEGSLGGERAQCNRQDTGSGSPPRSCAFSVASIPGFLLSVFSVRLVATLMMSSIMVGSDSTVHGVQVATFQSPVARGRIQPSQPPQGAVSLGVPLCAHKETGAYRLSAVCEGTWKNWDLNPGSLALEPWPSRLCCDDTGKLPQEKASFIDLPLFLRLDDCQHTCY